MKTKRLTGELLAVFIAAVGFFAGTPPPVSAQGPIEILLTVPAASLDLSDLDVRDENNRPVTSATEVNKFRNLFTQSLTQMLLFNLTPINRRLYDILSRSWDVFSDWFSFPLRRIQMLGSLILKNAKQVIRVVKQIAHLFLAKIRPSNVGSSLVVSLTLKILSSTQLLR